MVATSMAPEEEDEEVNSSSKGMEVSAQKMEGMEEEGVGGRKFGGSRPSSSSRPNTPPTSGSPLLPVDENEARDSYDDDEEMPDVEDEEAGFEPSEDMPYRRTRRYTIT